MTSDALALSDVAVLMTENQRQFHLEEFRQLKSEISMLLERVASLFKYGLIGSAAVYSWFLTNSITTAQFFQQSREVLIGASLIPPALVFFFGLLALVTYKHVNKMGLYLKDLERCLGHKETLGWEQYWRKEKPYLLWILLFFYVSLLLAELAVVYWVCHKF
ncbi:hypothetical protein [Pseudomonas sp.]|uniref:hypothetical protein n=1 Tax=Pseudomonas sp. TaxID=306 RepID=UPI003F3DE2DB